MGPVAHMRASDIFTDVLPHNGFKSPLIYDMGVAWSVGVLSDIHEIGFVKNWLRVYHSGLLLLLEHVESVLIPNLIGEGLHGYFSFLGDGVMRHVVFHLFLLIKVSDSV